MKIYLEEYINEDVYKMMSSHFTFTKDKTECEAVITRNLVVNKEFMEECLKLQCIAMYGTGLDGVDLAYAKEKGIAVFNAPKQNCLAVAELNVGMILAISRHLEKGFQDTKINGVIDYSGMLGNEISEKTVGFIGMGEISTMTARMLKCGFQCRTIGYNRTKKNNEYIEQVTLDEVLKESDYLVIGLALNEDTRGFMNYEKLAKMKRSAYLINCTRGAILNHDDLVRALREKLIRGYAADVFETEPVLVSDPLLKENVISTPHVGGNTVESLYRVGTLLYEELVDFENGKEPRYLIK